MKIVLMTSKMEQLSSLFVVKTIWRDILNNEINIRQLVDRQGHSHSGEADKQQNKTFVFTIEYVCVVV